MNTIDYGFAFYKFYNNKLFYTTFEGKKSQNTLFMSLFILLYLLYSTYVILA
jgi:hypothetical protein